MAFERSPRYFLVDKFSIWAHLPPVSYDILIRFKYFTNKQTALFNKTEARGFHLMGAK